MTTKFRSQQIIKVKTEWGFVGSDMILHTEARVLGRRGCALESASAEVCRERGGRVSTTVMVRDLDVPVPRVDGRRLEVVVDGLRRHLTEHKFAIDTTMVSAVQLGARGRCNAEGGQDTERAHLTWS